MPADTNKGACAEPSETWMDMLTDDTQTDRQTDRHTDYISAAWAVDREVVQALGVLQVWALHGLSECPVSVQSL